MLPSRSCSLLIGVLLLAWVGAAHAQSMSMEEIRQQARSACMIDVIKLCLTSVPDEERIMACMQTRRTELSAPCRQIFDIGMRARRKLRQQ